MTGMEVEFVNRPNTDGTTSTFSIEGCLVANTGSPNTRKPQITIHLPKSNNEDVDGAWVKYDGSAYHIVGVSAKSMNDNTPTRWNRYAIAEKVY